MSRTLKNPNIDPYILKRYDIIMYAVDTWGRKWKFAAWPKNGGTIAFFSSLSEMRTWVNSIVDFQRLMNDKPTIADMKVQGILRYDYRSY